MKKFLCMTMLMLAALTVSAGGADEGPKPPLSRTSGHQPLASHGLKIRVRPSSKNSNRPASVIPGAVADVFNTGIIKEL